MALHLGLSAPPPYVYDDEPKDDLEDMACLPCNLVSFMENNHLQRQQHSYRLSTWRSGLPLAGNNSICIPSRAAAGATATGGPGSGDAFSAITNLRIPSPGIIYEMQDFLKALVWANHDRLQWRPSQIEGPQLRGIFVKRDVFACDGGGRASTANASHLPYGELLFQPLPGLQSSGGELLNMHPGSGRSHMILSFADAATAVNRGRAKTQLRLPGYVSVSTPRNEAELTEWKKLVLACAQSCVFAIRRPE